MPPLPYSATLRLAHLKLADMTRERDLHKAVSDAVMGGATREKAIEKLRRFQGTQTSPEDYWYEYYGRIIEALEKLPAE